MDYTTEYEYYDDIQVKTVKDAMGNTTSFTYNQLGLLETITDAKGAVTKYEYDSLGNIKKLIDAEGNVDIYEYDEFGKPLSFKKFDQNWPGPDNTFGYTGYQYDVSSELYYAQARYYMAETGRFTSEDPWKGTIIDSKTLNPYPYVQNNPLKYIDPTGMVIEMIPGGEGPSRVTTKTSSPNIVNEVRKEVVEKEVNNTSEWNCRIVTEDVGNLDADYTSAVASSFSLAPPAPTVTEFPAIGLPALLNPITTGVIIGGIILEKPNYAGETQEELKNDKEFQQLILLSETEGKEDGKATNKAVNPGKDHPYNPGIPTEEDGFITPKKWNGKKVKTKSGQYGYPDKSGNVWVPTNPGNAHGGAHWDVQHPDGTHTNVYPK